MKGTLYIVSTPIGNLEDITLRALRVLKEVDLIAAEDTRRTSKLLNHYGIVKSLISYWGEKEKAKSAELLSRLHAGQSVALVSDSGTPGVSDPGAVVIREAIAEGFAVVSVPGPSAVISALTVSGLLTREFTFAGFLPPRKNQRQKALKDHSLEERTLVFYEAPHRVLETLADMEEILGQRQAAVVKEMTKMHEEVLRGDIADMRRAVSEKVIAGEYVIVVEGRKEGGASFDDALHEVWAMMKKGKGRKEAATLVSKQYGLSKKELYDRSLEES